MAVDDLVIEQVEISKLEFLAALNGIKIMDDDLLLASSKCILSRGWCPLFTKNGTLKRPLGKAHKGWTLTGFCDGAFQEVCRKLEENPTTVLTFGRRRLAFILGIYFCSCW